MSERRLYYDPTDDFQADVLVPTVKAHEPFGDEVVLIPLDPNSYPSSTRAREDNVDAHDTPMYIFRDEPDGSITEGRGFGFIEAHCIDGETYDRLADEHGFIDWEHGTVVHTREEAVSQEEAGLL